MSSYQDDRQNKRNLNNFNEGITDTNIRDRRLNYQYNGLSPNNTDLSHGYQLSLACQSGTDMVHSIGNVTSIVLQFIIDQFPRNTFATALPFILTLLTVPSFLVKPQPETVDSSTFVAPSATLSAVKSSDLVILSRRSTPAIVVVVCT